MNNPVTNGGQRKPKNTWLAGKIKCGRCGTSAISKSHRNVSHTGLYCRRRLDRKSCEGCGTLRTSTVEQFVYDKMAKKLIEFHMLTGIKYEWIDRYYKAKNIEMVDLDFIAKGCYVLDCEIDDLLEYQK